ncbi:hypothetical protein CRM22_007156 [Opisthorchis felineus]|uniref:PDZ domain-containing protein n=1 Tax=Opisthorchis felineus TaxID=147828 RepID=A0A4S2LQF3_OPIFE|nr:hypothetical protein CRM22_007156 [Opisthorchis felineus]
MFKCLPFVKPCGKQVDHIDRRHAKLEHVPDEVMRNFRTLEECRLDANQIKELPKNFFRLERIRYLTLSDNDITEIPPGVGKFSHLIELDISRNEISVLPTSIRFCDSLQIVDISNNPLHSLPAGFCQLSKLRILCMNDISLTELPADFGELHLLEKCELRDNCLKSLPDSFAQLVRLEFLDLGSNEFQEMPAVLGQLVNLAELWMDDNELKALPPEVGNMQRLQQLDLSENAINALPDEIGGMVSLCDLNLSQNNLNCLPKTFGQLKKLTVLKLNQNQLLTLTPSIGGCSGLQELYLTENFLPTLPATIGNLTSTFLLNVDQNQLTDLPVEIGKCTSLNILSLRENLLRRIPKEIGNCLRLRVLDVSGNRLERLPLTLAQCPLTALWLSPNQSQPVITLQRDVDEITQEQFLTCYLLPQDQLTSHIELDPTMTPSELASLTAPLGPTTDSTRPIPDTEAIQTETNYAYEPAHSILSGLSHTPLRWTDDQPGARPASVNSSTTSGTRMPSAPVSPTGLDGPGNIYKQSATTRFSPSPRNSLSVQSGDMDPNNSGFSRVHFSTNAKQDESKALGKGFPKTRHPRISRKSADGLLPNREERRSIDSATYGEHRMSDANSPTDSVRKAASPVVNGHSQANGPQTSRFLAFDCWQNADGSHRPSPHPGFDGDYRDSVVEESSEEDARGPTPPKSPRSGPKVVVDSTPHAKPRNKIFNAPNAVVSETSPGLVDHPRKSPRLRDSSKESRPSRLETNEVARLSVQDNLDEEAYSSGGEEICVISRRVGFTDDVEDNEEKSNQKLIRRDTPHYTKRARIQSKTADGVDSEEAVLKILAKYQGSASPHPGVSDTSVDRTDGTLRMLAAALSNSVTDSAANRSERASTALPSTTVADMTRRPQQQMVVVIRRQPGSGLGLSIAGGVGSIPYQDTDQGIFVSRLNPDGLAFSSGLRLNDKILEVNGTSLVNVEHHVAVSALRANTDEFRIVVSRDASNPADGVAPSSSIWSPNVLSTLSFTSGTNRLTPTDSAFQHIKCTIHREPSGLGFSIAGGRGTLPTSLDHGQITISKITDGGAASKCGNLRVGDQLIKVNGIDVKDARHDQVIALLTGSGSYVDLELLRPLSQFTKPTAPSTTTAANGHVCSLGQERSSYLSMVNTPHPSPKTKESWLGATPGLTNNLLSSGSVAEQQPVRLRTENGYAVDQVTIRSNGGPLGLAIYGGSDINCLPFADKEPGVFISKISTDGAAQHTGLRVGDRILRVNDIDLRHATHDKAVRALIQTTKELKLEVRRDPTPPGLRRLSISRRVGERFGLRIAGGVPPVTEEDSSRAAQLSSSSNNGSIFVTWISPDGAVGRDGRLKPGDRLLEVNGHWLMGNTLTDALEVFRKAGPTLNLVVCDGSVDFVLPSKPSSPTDNDAPVSVTVLGQPAVGGHLAGSAVDHLDEMSHDLHSIAAYSDAKRQFLSNMSSSPPYQVTSPQGTCTASAVNEERTPGLPTTLGQSLLPPRSPATNTLSSAFLTPHATSFARTPSILSGDTSSTSQDDSVVIASPVPSSGPPLPGSQLSACFQSPLELCDRA